MHKDKEPAKDRQRASGREGDLVSHEVEQVLTVFQHLALVYLWHHSDLM